MTTAIKPSDSSFIDRHTLTLEANRVRVVSVYGRTFACADASGEFEMSFNDGAYFAVRKGIEWGLVGEDRYNVLRFRAAVSTTIVFYAGNFFWHENSVVPIFSAARTKCIPGATSILAAGVVLLNTVPAGLSYRKSVIITNLDPAADLEVEADDPDNPGTWIGAAMVFARQAWYLETSDALRIRNASAGTVDCRIVETFYYL